MRQRDEGLEILKAYLAKTCTIEGCEHRTSRQGQPCDPCMKELGVGG